MLLPMVLSVVVLILYAKAQLIKAKRKKRRIIAIILMLVTFYIAIQPTGAGALIWIPPVYSETDNPEHYMVLGTYAHAYGNSIPKLFPATIPRSAVADGANWYPPDKFPETTKYYYYLIFAYNDTTNTVRYIASYAMDTGGSEDPYFLSLDW